MFDKCIKCARIGVSCVPNLMLLPFGDLIAWCIKRQKHLEWTNQVLAENSKVPVGTINRIRAVDYDDCRYSTIQRMLIALIGGTTDEFSCTEMVERELAQKEEYERQAAMVTKIMEENAATKEAMRSAEEAHRAEICALKEEHREQVQFLRDEVKAWRKIHAGV